MRLVTVDSAAMRRLVLAFSKRPEQHRAAVALNYVHYNLCHVVRTLRVTPAMAVGVVKGPWSLEELLDALLEAEPCDPPAMQPLAFPKPAETSRELPNGRGFLRALPGGKGAPAVPTPEAPTPAPSAAASGQLDLLAYRAPIPAEPTAFAPRPVKPLPPKGTQLSLFGEPEEVK